MPKLVLYNGLMRKFIFLVILLLGIIFFITRFTEVQKIYTILQLGSWRFVWLALFVQGLSMLNVSASYQSIYYALGIQESLPRLFQLSSAANFVNIVTPASGGVPALAVYLSNSRQRGQPTGNENSKFAGRCAISAGSFYQPYRVAIDPSELSFRGTRPGLRQ
jgi:uncharacterized membrane protein YbhN (UPF0104 family)